MGRHPSAETALRENVKETLTPTKKVTQFRKYRFFLEQVRVKFNADGPEDDP